MSEKRYKVYVLIVEAGGVDENDVKQSAVGQEWTSSGPWTIETARKAMEDLVEVELPPEEESVPGLNSDEYTHVPEEI